MLRLWRRLSLALVLLVVVPLGAMAGMPTLTGRVVRVVDGDTIHVRIGERIEKVRYIGMNAPDLNHPTKGVEAFGRQAAEANRKLVEDQTVRLEVDVQERDTYGRLLAYVYVGNIMVNGELLAEGYAQVMTIPPNVKHQDLLVKAQREARVLQIGLWKDTGVPGASRASSAPTRAAPPMMAGIAPGARETQARPGVPPQDAWACPPDHPIKGNSTTSGEGGIGHLLGSAFYGMTKPERCHASVDEAKQDGSRASKW